ncbi:MULTISPECIES: HAMP domain-containing sensor histidine kinase [unclassified Clostridium]|uniref:sensor histidine kinase n=1 Tax=Clostridium TaxID=1485 RepID=UPI001C8BF5EC|nr:MULTISPECIES: HAMP domain-containing sensor histidine kinase [unclassified Clostridium]MBX9137755.1 HAMP domain-containing histidine kinase [Clostridium sp. K12(2020)]MBX9144620.1 HAMP domain-containing histidine kinase [Clostridium sp. K13]MDU2289265.1 HAMP domain-containing sensor histidine kinase [Clostridium celatum]MDU4325852.1 HAMP domain-containing sensor histidine kinase [Clostridium celatum]
MEKTRKYEEQSKKYIIYMLISTILFLICSLILIKVINVNEIKSLPILKDLNSINIIIGIIAIPCCLLYYYMYRNNEFFILTLSYISIFIEYIYLNYIVQSIGLSGRLITFPFIFRIFLLTIAIFNESKYVKKIIDKKRLSVIVVLIINIIGTYLEVKLNLNIFFRERNTFIWNIFQINILIYYAILLGLLAIRCMRKREFIYTIFITTISVFTIRRVFYFRLFNDCSSKVIEYNKVLTFIAYLILLIGLYIEVVRRIEESIRLNSQVNDFKKLKIKYKEIKEVEKAKGQFFANLSHEIKTPINIIYSCVQLLDINKKEGDRALWDAYNKYDNTIKQNCYRLLRLVNNLVDMTKIDSGYMSLTFVNYEIVSLVEDIILSIVPYVESKNINVLFDTYIEELEIKCDPESIERVILNLLSNAVKFTNYNGNIFVFMDADDDYVTIRIKDDGVGISEEVQEEIFKRFVQEDKSFNRKKEGSGIGLALVKSLVELHGGQVYLEKGIEKGSEFVVKLPNVRIETEEETDNKIIDVDNKPLVQKIHIEFSDIYELY